MSAERKAAFDAARAERCELAQRLIRMAYPELSFQVGGFLYEYEATSEGQPLPETEPEVLPGEEKASEQERLHDGLEPR